MLAKYLGAGNEGGSLTRRLKSHQEKKEQQQNNEATPGKQQQQPTENLLQVVGNAYLLSSSRPLRVLSTEVESIEESQSVELYRVFSTALITAIIIKQQTPKQK